MKNCVKLFENSILQIYLLWDIVTFCASFSARHFCSLKCICFYSNATLRDLEQHTCNFPTGYKTIDLPGKCACITTQNQSRFNRDSPFKVNLLSDSDKVT